MSRFFSSVNIQTLYIRVEKVKPFFLIESFIKGFAHLMGHCTGEERPTNKEKLQKYSLYFFFFFFFCKYAID